MRLIDADDVDNHIVGSVNLSGCPTINAIPIPEDATNGDVIKVVFPNCEIITLADGTISVKYKEHGCWVHYESDWWNAKYKEVK